MSTAWKFAVILVMMAIIASLGSALFHLARGRGDSHKMFRALALRVGLSMTLFLVLMAAWYLGWIAPHGLPPR